MVDENTTEEDDNDDDGVEYVHESEHEAGVFRWMSFVVVLLAVAGFFGLAWYAYKSGGDAVDEKDAELIQADNTPVKEAPANPGGMPIPNQDKSVYALVGGKHEDKVAEHILASPETPVARNDEPETGTWMSDDVKEKLKAMDEQKPASDSKNSSANAPVEPAKEPDEEKPVKPVQKAEQPKAEQFNPPKVAKPIGEIKELKLEGVNDPQMPKPQESKPQEQTTQVALVVAQPTDKTAPPADLTKPASSSDEADDATEQPAKPATKQAPKPEPKKEEAAAETKAPEAPAKSAASTKLTPPAGVRAQLGAYKSQQEAEDEWKKISRKFGSDLQDKDHYIVRADLGAKGIYYRLQLAPFDNTKSAEEFCLALVSEGQGCFPAKGK